MQSRTHLFARAWRMSHANKKRRVTQRNIAFFPSCDSFGADNCDKWNTIIGVSRWSPWSGKRAKEFWLVAFIHFTPTSSLTVQGERAHFISREIIVIFKSNKWWRANTFASDICVSCSMRCAQWLMDVLFQHFLAPWKTSWTMSGQQSAHTMAEMHLFITPNHWINYFGFKCNTFATPVSSLEMQRSLHMD